MGGSFPLAGRGGQAPGFLSGGREAGGSGQGLSLVGLHPGFLVQVASL